MRRNISTNSSSEIKVGYSRAVLVNGRVYVSGTTSTNEPGNTVGKSVYDQATHCFKKVLSAIKSAGFTADDVVSVTAYLVDMKRIEEFDRAFAEHFFEVKPCCTLVGIKDLVREDLLVEIECVAEKAED